MNKVKAFICGIIVLIILASSTRHNQEDNIRLRAIMKSIKSEADEIRKTLLEGKAMNFKYTYHKQILTATSKNKKASTPYFKTRAENYLLKLKKYNESKDKKKSFNELVDACISCHDYASKIYVGRIKKLYIDE